MLDASLAVGVRSLGNHVSAKAFEEEEEKQTEREGEASIDVVWKKKNVDKLRMLKPLVCFKDKAQKVLGKYCLYVNIPQKCNDQRFLALRVHVNIPK